MIPASEAGPLDARERIALYLVAAVVAFLTAFHAPFDELFTDMFHEGEYLAPRLFFARADAHPLLIHGYINYLPAEVAARLCGADRVIGCTRALNAGAGVLASFLFFGCAFAIARGRARLLLAGAGVTAILLLINGRLGDVVQLSQGIPSVREVGLMAMLWLLLAAQDRRPMAADLLAAAAGLVAGLTIFWTYNRGLIGVIAIGGYAVASLPCGRGWRHALPPAGGLLVGLAGAVLIDPEMWRQHLSNIHYWAANSGIFRSRSLRQTAHALPVYLSVAAALLAAGRRGWRWWQADRRRELPILLVLMAIPALVTQQASKRADFAHLTWIVPWLFLLVAFLLDRHDPAPARDERWTELARRHRGLIAAIVAALLLDYSSSPGFTRPMIETTADNLVLLAHGMPRDRDITPGPQRDIAAALRRSGERCTYVFNNGGGYYHLANLPPCSAAMYPVYVSPAIERRVIADLSRSRPDTVVGLSPDWFSKVDDKSLAMRTPLLAAWLEENYPIVETIGRTQVRRARRAPAGPAR